MLGHPGSQGEEFCDRQLNKMSWEREFLTVKRMVRHWYRLATLWNSSGLWLELPLLYGTQVTRSQFCFWDIWSLVLLSYPEALSDLVTLEVTSRLPKVSKNMDVADFLLLRKGTPRRVLMTVNLSAFSFHASPSLWRCSAWIVFSSATNAYLPSSSNSITSGNSSLPCHVVGDRGSCRTQVPWFPVRVHTKWLLIRALESNSPGVESQICIQH